MTTLFSDQRLPMVGELSNNHRNFDRERLHLFDEKNVFDALIQEEMFPFYSNSYLVVIGEETPVIYSKYSNDRSLDKSIKTEIVLEDGVKKFRKYALTKDGADHIRNINNFYKKLSLRYEGSKLEINRCRLVEDSLPYVELEYIEGVTLAELLDNCLQKGDKEGFKNLFKEYVERISYGEESEITDYDMIFSNILVNKDKWTVIDYEWTKEEKIETKEIAYRSLYCYLLENNRRAQCDQQWILQYLGIKPEEEETYRKNEVRFQEGVMGQRKSMAQLINEIGGKVFEVDYWRGKIREYQEHMPHKAIQIYVDRGQGYRIDDLIYVEDAFVSEHEIKFQMQIDQKVQNLRIDPVDEPCICRVKECILNGENLLENRKEIISGNGQRAGDTMVFATLDPNIYITTANLNLKQENTIGMTIEIAALSENLCKDISEKIKAEEKVEKIEVKRKLGLWSRR